MKKIAIGLSLAALAVAGTAMADQAWGPGKQDATVTRADALARAAQMFDRLDVNKDAKLDPADREAMQSAKFDTIDSNHDGQLSRAEFMAMRPIGGPGMARDHMGGGHMGGHGMGGMMLMHMADANKDGAVTKDEFAAAAATRFDSADTNHDGSLTPAERQSAHQAMRERMHSMMERRMNGDGAMPPASPPAN